ncbi:unnamed protein product [Penicillium roqueforti FM164]|uniref:Uncharacterized protein n=1 Tax=Penicillium roqueforti (strain FM164) TaxID=1365484 RepID=W6QNZ9_PENRF|nr:unnamed protein product [Penicillium roqueforti FM164]
MIRPEDRFYSGGVIWQTGGRLRQVALEKGQYCFQWQRPPQSRLLKKAKDCVQ